MAEVVQGRGWVLKPFLPSCCLSHLLGWDLRLMACCRPDIIIAAVLSGFRESMDGIGNTLPFSHWLPCSYLAIHGLHQMKALLVAKGFLPNFVLKEHCSVEQTYFITHGSTHSPAGVQITLLDIHRDVSLGGEKAHINTRYIKVLQNLHIYLEVLARRTGINYQRGKWKPSWAVALSLARGVVYSDSFPKQQV